MSEKSIGVIIFYLNYNPDIEGLSFKDQVEIFKELNSDFIKQLEVECNYRVAIVPTTKESCRVEKMDFDCPFPRFVPNNVDVRENEQNKLLIKKLIEKRYKNEEEKKE